MISLVNPCHHSDRVRVTSVLLVRLLLGPWEGSLRSFRLPGAPQALMAPAVFVMLAMLAEKASCVVYTAPGCVI